MARILVASFTVLGALILFGCSTNAPRYTPPDDSRTIDVAVRHFKTDLAGRQYSGQTDFGALVAENLAGALQELGFVAIALPLDASLPDGIRYVFDGDVLTLDPGSWNLRFWIGFGAGNAELAARGWVTELQTNELKLDETLRARSNTWQGEENILRRASSKVALLLARRYAATMTGTRSPPQRR